MNDLEQTILYTKESMSSDREKAIIGTAISIGKKLLSNYEFDSDSSLSDSETEILLTLICSKKKRNKAKRIERYVEETIHHFTDKQFQSNFRITRETFQSLLIIVGPQIENTNTTGTGRPMVPVEKQLLATIWLLATPDSYRSVGERFDLSKSTLFSCFVRITTALNDLAPQVIHWPTEQELPLVKEKFKAMAGIDGVIGALDGTYVPIKAPSKDPETYRNRKMQYAITLQAICDANLKFIDSYSGYPSSVHDARIFRNSDIYNLIRQNPEKYFPNDEFILADKAYPTLKWCITPYINRGNLTRQQGIFNTRVSQTRQTIERAFALLFGRFRRLKYLDMNRVDLIPKTILACCVLHNICLDFSDDLICEYVQEGMEAIMEKPQEQIIYENENEKRLGNERRDALCKALNQNRRQM